MYVNRQRNRVFFHHCVSDADFGTWSTLSPPSKKKKKRITQKEEKKRDVKKAQYAAITITTAKYN